MSLEELRADLKRNAAEVANLTTVEQVRDHLLNTLWPFLEAKLDVVDEIDDAVAELVDQQEDYLQPETAAIFAAVVQGGRVLAAELKELMPKAGLTRGTVGADRIGALIEQYEQACQHAQALLGDITMMPVEADGDAPERDGDADE